MTSATLRKLAAFHEGSMAVVGLIGGLSRVGKYLETLGTSEESERVIRPECAGRGIL